MNNNSLLILTPMQEENVIVREMLANLGYNENDLHLLQKENRFSLQVTGMGTINTMNFIYNMLEFFRNKTVDVLLIGFAGALSHELHIGDSCQVATVTDFSYITCQEAGDFEIITTPSDFFDRHLIHDAQNPLLPHIRLQASMPFQGKSYNLISVPGLLQGEKTKEYLCTQGIEMVDMEGFSLAAALQHLQQNKILNTNINLDILRVITDSPKEKFQFTKLEEYKEHLRKSELIGQILKNKVNKM